MKKKIYYKGFDKNLRCRGFQYEIGKSYTHKGEIKPCESGFHACEYPLSVFNYYAPANSRFAVVEASGKIACEKLKIKAELSFDDLIKAAIKFTFDRAKWCKGKSANGSQGAALATGYQGAASATGIRGAASATGDQGVASATGIRGAASATGSCGAASATGDQGAASATGYRGAASATGYRGAALATGDQGAASATGDQGIACALGYKCKAKGEKGCWLVLAERGETGKILNVKTFCVDGKNIKENIFYILENGKLTEAINE